MATARGHANFGPSKGVGTPWQAHGMCADRVQHEGSEQKPTRSAAVVVAGERDSGE